MASFVHVSSLFACKVCLDAVSGVNSPYILLLGGDTQMSVLHLLFWKTVHTKIYICMMCEQGCW